MTTSKPQEHMWDCYAAVARAILKGREDGYPRMVEAGKLAPAEADRRIATMRAAVEIWQSAWECRLPDPAVVGSYDRCDIIEELARARQLTAARIATDPSNQAAAWQIRCLDEMIAWHTRFIDGPHFCVRITLHLRAGGLAPDQRQAA